MTRPRKPPSSRSARCGSSRFREGCHAEPQRSISLAFQTRDSSLRLRASLRMTKCKSLSELRAIWLSRDQTVPRSDKKRRRIWAVEDGQMRRKQDLLAAEEPLEIRLRAGAEQRTVAITMRTPG